VLVASPYQTSAQGPFSTVGLFLFRNEHKGRLVPIVPGFSPSGTAFWQALTPLSE